MWPQSHLRLIFVCNRCDLMVQVLVSYTQSGTVRLIYD